MTAKEEFLNYTNQNYEDIAFNPKSEGLFPDIETGYHLVKIVYNRAYHALDLRFNGMAEYDLLFGEYVFPVLMKYKDFSIWKVGSARVVRVKVPCFTEDVGFIEEDCDEQMERARELIEILSQIDVPSMYQKLKILKEEKCSDIESVIFGMENFTREYKEMLDLRAKEMESVGKSSLGKKGILFRLSSMRKEINAFILIHSKNIENEEFTRTMNILGEYLNATELFIQDLV